MYDLNEFAQRLKYFREKKGWTQPQLAEKTGVAESTIYFYEFLDKKNDMEYDK